MTIHGFREYQGGYQCVDCGRKFPDRPSPTGGRGPHAVAFLDAICHRCVKP